MISAISCSRSHQSITNSSESYHRPSTTTYYLLPKSNFLILISNSTLHLRITYPSISVTPYVDPHVQFKQGYQQCMNEVTKILLSSQVDENVTHKLVEHLSTHSPAPSLSPTSAGTFTTCLIF